MDTWPVKQCAELPSQERNIHDKDKEEIEDS